jgi:hypothetical protein
MKTLRADQIKRGDPVWVWDGWWLPAEAADVVCEPGRECLIVQFENGGCVPSSWEEVERRDPDAGGADKPYNRGPGRTSAHTT